MLCKTYLTTRNETIAQIVISIFQQTNKTFLELIYNTMIKKLQHYTGIEVIDEANSHQSSNQY